MDKIALIATNDTALIILLTVLALIIGLIIYIQRRREKSSGRNPHRVLTPAENVLEFADRWNINDPEDAKELYGRYWHSEKEPGDRFTEGAAAMMSSPSNTPSAT